MHNHVRQSACWIGCVEYGANHPSERYLPNPTADDARWDENGPAVETVFELWDGRQVVREDCNPETFGYERQGIVSYESTVYGNIVYIPNVKVWWTK